MRVFYAFWQVAELAAGYRYTTLRFGWQGSGGAQPPGWTPAHARPARPARAPSGAGAIGRTPSGGGWGVTGTSGTGRAQRRRCLPRAPPGEQRGEARGSGCSRALPSRRGARTSPRSPAVRGGRAAATLHLPLHGPVRGRLRRQAHMFDHSCASLWRPGRRGGIASAVCAMAQPWTTVAWAVWPARPNDPTACSRGRSNAEPTARRSGMTATIPPVSKARERVAHGHRSTEARGMPGGEARAARGGEPAGAPTPRGGGCPWGMATFESSRLL